MSQALNRCVNCLPGQRDVDNAIRTVGEASKSLLADSVSITVKCYFYVSKQGLTKIEEGKTPKVFINEPLLPFFQIFR